MPLIDCKCPCCGAPLKINDAAQGSLRCPYCGSEYLAEQAITNITNVTNVSTVNNYAGATIIKNGGKEEFEISQGVLTAYNGNDSEVIIPDSVRKINCEFNEYVKKIVIPSGLLDINPSVARSIIPVLDLSKNSLFKIENGILYKDNTAIAYGPSVTEFHLKKGEQYTLELFEFIEKCTFVTDVYLAEDCDCYLYEKTLSGRAMIHIMSYHSTYAMGFSEIDDEETIYIDDLSPKHKKKLCYSGEALILNNQDKESERIVADNKKIRDKIDKIRNDSKQIVNDLFICKKQRNKALAGLIVFSILLVIFLAVSIVCGVSIKSIESFGIISAVLCTPFLVFVIINLIRFLKNQKPFMKLKKQLIAIEESIHELQRKVKNPNDAYKK